MLDLLKLLYFRLGLSRLVCLLRWYGEVERVVLEGERKVEWKLEV